MDGPRESLGSNLRRSFSLDGSGLVKAASNLDVVIDSDTSKEEVIQAWLEYSKYVPTFLRQSILRFDGSLDLVPERVRFEDIPPCRDQRFTAVGVVDISGFTSLTQRRGRVGPLGAEILHTFLDQYFDLLIGEAERYGGDVFKIAGDAIIFLFIPNKLETKEQVCARATACIQKLVVSLGCVKFSRYGTVEIVPSEAEERRGDTIEQSWGTVDRKAPENPLQWLPVEHVDEGIDERVEHCLDSIVNGILKRDHATRPTLRTGRAKLQPAEKVYSGTIGAREKAKEVLRQVGADIWQVYERLMAEFSLSIAEAQSSTLGESIHHASNDLSGLQMIDGGYLHQPGEDDVWDSQLVYTKGILSCGDLVYYRIQGEEKTDGFVEPGPLWECVAADAITGSKTGGCFADISAMDKVILPSQILLSAEFYSHVRDYVTVKELGRAPPNGVDGHGGDRDKAGTASTGIVRLTDVRGRRGELQTSCSMQFGHNEHLKREKIALHGHRLQKCVVLLRSLASHVPAAVKSIQSGISGGAPIVAHRTASIMFMGFPGLRLRHNLDLMQQIMHFVSKRLVMSGGDLLTMRNDEKGIMIIAGHGLPDHARGLDYFASTIAVADAVDIASSLEAATGQAVVIGLATGRVLFTSVGSDLRREYTMYGEAMNRAAKIMTIGASLLGRGVICDDITRAIVLTRAEATTVHFDELKGNDIHPGMMYVVRERRNPTETRREDVDQSTSVVGPVDRAGLYALAPLLDEKLPFKQFLDKSNKIFIGGAAEVNLFLGHVHRLVEGKGNTICMEGLAGTGKTFLMEQVFVHQMKDLDLPCKPAVVYVSHKTPSKVWAGCTFLDVLVRDFYAGCPKRNKDEDRSDNNCSVERNRWVNELCRILHVHRSEVVPSTDDVGTSRVQEMGSLVDDFLASKLRDKPDECKEFYLQDQSDDDVLSSLIVFAVTRYTDSKGPLVLIFDNTESAHIAIWDAACKIRALKKSRVLLVLAFRWPFLAFRAIAELGREARIARTESESSRVSIIIGRPRRLEVAAFDIGMLHWMDPDGHPIESIPSPLGRLACSIFFDDSVTKVPTPSWSTPDVVEYMKQMFPGAHPPLEAYELINSMTGGTPYSVKFVAVFLYLYHQLKDNSQGTRNEMEIPMAMLTKVRTFAPLWPAAQIRMDTLTPSMKQLAMRMVLLGDVFSEQLLIIFCKPELSEEAVKNYLQFLVFMRYIDVHHDEEGCTYYEFVNRSIVSITLDMLAVDARKRLRAQLAALLERYEYRRGGVDWKAVSFNWLTSCQLSQEIHWKRCLRSIASCERYALVSWKAKDYKQVSQSLGNAVVGAMILLTRHVRQREDEARISLLVPTWRVAGWERAIAACDLILNGKDRAEGGHAPSDKVDACLSRVSAHCRRALTLLGINGDELPSGCSLSALYRHVCVLGYHRDSLRVLACPGAPGRLPRTALLQCVSSGLELDANLETVAFLPGKYSDEEAERMLEIRRVSSLLEMAHAWPSVRRTVGRTVR